jgi:hypothetical protein
MFAYFCKRTLLISNILKCNMTLRSLSSLNKISFRRLVRKDNIKYYKNKSLFLYIGVNFINILSAAFSYKCFARNFLYLNLRFVLLWRKNIGANAARIMFIHEHGQKLWGGVHFLKNSRGGGVIKISDM